jgi:hypothetical protein
MIKLVIGSFVGGVAMFIVGFIFWATPLNHIGLSQATEAQSSALQLGLSQNLPHTGRYIVPNPDTSGGTVLYGRGPVAIVDYNSGGFSTADSAAMIGGFVQEVVIALLIGLSLYAVAGRVTDFASRARLVVGFGAAAGVLMLLSDPIWMHADWRYAIYAFVADVAMFVAAGLVIARWFLPKPVSAL